MIATSHGFNPVLGDTPHTLILGSMPGVKSLDEQQYYAHPRNTFWPIMSALFNISNEANYAQRCLALTQHNIAVWDVLKSCQRQGSLDQHIEEDSIEINDFTHLFRNHPTLNRVLFNGGAAEKLFRKHVLITLSTTVQQSLKMYRLPSTSPAHASKNFQQKLTEWQQIIETKKPD